MDGKRIDQYIMSFSPEKQIILQKIRETIHTAIPDAEEHMSYGMPGFWQGESLIWFAGQKNHIGIYPTNSGISAFQAELTSYKSSKGAFQIPWEDEIPYMLIAKIAKFRLSEVKNKYKK